MRLLRPTICIVLCLGLGFLSGLTTQDSIPNWYAGLKKPSFNPPNWIFGPVWSLLYIMMGLAAGLIWNLGLEKPGVKGALLVFATQFALNLAWTPVFFGMHRMDLAFGIIVLLWLSILFCVVRFWKLKPLCGGLLVPYLLWGSFATLLNYSLWQMNS